MAKGAARMTPKIPDEGVGAPGPPWSVSPLVGRKSMWLHGAGLSGATWQSMTADLPLACTPDLPGHGTAAMVHPPRVETYADVLRNSVPKNAVLIGHSLGGMVALELADQLGDRAAALILVEAVPTVRDRLSTQISAALAARLFSLLPLRWLAELSGLGQPAATRAELRRQFKQFDRPRLRAALQAAQHYDGRARLPQVKVPTLVITGRKNGATEHGASLMADRIADARLLQLPGGHMLHTDSPAQLRRAIDDFLLNRLGDDGPDAPKG